MKQALISPNEKLNIDVPNDPVRLAQVADIAFPVAPPLFWTVCNDDVEADLWYYAMLTGEILRVPEPPPSEPDQLQPTVEGAQTL